LRPRITISQPKYLVGPHNNIPLKQDWNSSLLAGLDELQTEISQDKPGTDIHEITVDRNDDFKEFNAAGDFGYSVSSPNNERSGYYYVDFELSSPEAYKSSVYRRPEFSIALSKRLCEYVENESKYHLDKCIYGLTSDDDGLRLRLRAYFIKNAQ